MPNFGNNRMFNKEWSSIPRLGVPSEDQAPSAQLWQRQYCDSQTHSGIHALRFRYRQQK